MRLTRRAIVRLAGAALAPASLGPTSSGRVTAAQTPDAAPGESSPNETLLSMLQFIPLSLVEENYRQGYELATFGDAALRLASVGLEISDLAASTEDFRDVAQATLPVPHGSLAQASLRAEDSLSLFGWTITDIHQSVYAMTSEGLVHVMRGSFDPSALDAVWLANGYQMLDVEGHAVASVSAERNFDLSTELGRLTLGSANNTAFLEDGTLLYGGSLEALTAMLQAHNGAVPSLGSYALVESVVGAIGGPLSGASLLPGPALISGLPLVLGADVDLDLEDLPEPGPVPLMALVGFVSGPAVPDADLTNTDAEPIPSGSMLVAALKFLTAGEAAIAARRALLELETGTGPTSDIPFTERFAGWRVSHHADSDTMTLEIDLYGNENVWLQMIYNRDASFLYS
ncbi:hypothetical protein BH20CHL4_BH20CHL4_13570 [soil metagenome]